MTTKQSGRIEHGQETGSERCTASREVSRETSMHELDQTEQKAELKALIRDMLNRGELDRELARNYGIRRLGHDGLLNRTREEQRG